MTNLEVLRMNLCFKRSKLCNPPTSSHHQTCYAFHTFLFFLQLLFSLVGIRNLSKVSMQFRAIRNLIKFYKDTYIYDKIDLFFPKWAFLNPLPGKHFRSFKHTSPALHEPRSVPSPSPLDTSHSGVHSPFAWQKWYWSQEPLDSPLPGLPFTSQSKTVDNSWILCVLSVILILNLF